jgi:hypothetical protein
MRPMIVRRAASCKQNLLYDNFKILSHLISRSLNLMTIMNHNELYANHLMSVFDMGWIVVKVFSSEIP